MYEIAAGACALAMTLYRKFSFRHCERSEAIPAMRNNTAVTRNA